MDIPHFSPEQYVALGATARRQAQLLRRQDIVDGVASGLAWLKRLVGTRRHAPGGAACRS
jgi:hypothetical protein